MLILVDCCFSYSFNKVNTHELATAMVNSKTRPNPLRIDINVIVVFRDAMCTFVVDPASNVGMLKALLVCEVSCSLLVSNMFPSIRLVCFGVLFSLPRPSSFLFSCLLLSCSYLIDAK